METIKTFLDSFKELIWDIIGYFLPGFFLLLLLSVCVQSQFFLESSMKGFDDLDGLVLFVVSYVLGFVIYGFGFLKEQVLGKHSYKTKLENSIKERNDFHDVHKIVEEKIESETGSPHSKPYGVRELRNIVMRKEDEQKVYTFTFRSDLSANIGNTLFMLGFMGLVQSVSHWLFHWPSTSSGLFKSGQEFLLLYPIMIVAYFLLRYTRNRFYDIAMRLPFSIFLAQKLK
jgi:hypothetical protein